MSWSLFSKTITADILCVGGGGGGDFQGIFSVLYTQIIFFSLWPLFLYDNYCRDCVGGYFQGVTVDLLFGVHQMGFAIWRAPESKC